MLDLADTLAAQIVSMARERDSTCELKYDEDEVLKDATADILAALRSAVPPSDEVRSALEPFARALRYIDDGTPPDLRCDDDYPLEDAMWKKDQPTVGDLRKLVAALSLPPSEPVQADVAVGQR